MHRCSPHHKDKTLTQQLVRSSSWRAARKLALLPWDGQRACERRRRCRAQTPRLPACTARRCQCTDRPSRQPAAPPAPTRGRCSLRGAAHAPTDARRRARRSRPAARLVWQPSHFGSTVGAPAGGPKTALRRRSARCTARRACFARMPRQQLLDAVSGCHSQVTAGECGSKHPGTKLARQPPAVDLHRRS